MKRSNYIWAALLLAMAWLSSGCGGAVPPPVAPTPTPNPVNLSPTISSLSPDSALAPCFFCTPQPFTLTVIGSNFVPESTVNWKGSPRPTTFVNSTHLAAIISANDTLSSIGPVPITVTNPPNLTSNVVNFTLIANP